VQVTAEKCGWTDYHVVTSFPGTKVEGAVFRHPFLERESLGILADYITLDQGHRCGAYCARARPGGLRQRTKVRAPCLLPRRRGRQVLPCRRRPGTAAGRDHREDHLGSNPLVIEILKAHGGLMGLAKLATRIPTAGAATIR